MSEEQCLDESIEEEILRRMLENLAASEQFDASSLQNIGKMCKDGGLAKPDAVREVVLVKQVEDA